MNRCPRCICDGLANIGADRPDIGQTLDRVVQPFDQFTDRLKACRIDLAAPPLEQGQQRIGAIVLKIGDYIAERLNKREAYLARDGKHPGDHAADRGVRQLLGNSTASKSPTSCL